MEVTIKYLSPYRYCAGKEQQIVSLPEGGTLNDLIKNLEELVPQLFPMAKSAKYIINGNLANLETVLKDSDQVLIFVALAGG